MAELIDRNALIAEYDRVHVGAPGGARKLMQDAPTVNRWIPVEDALPEDGQRVLICSKSKRLFDVVFRANAQMPFFDTKIFGKVCAWYCGDVIKWLPLDGATDVAGHSGAKMDGGADNGKETVL